MNQGRLFGLVMLSVEMDFVTSIPEVNHRVTDMFAQMKKLRITVCLSKLKYYSENCNIYSMATTSFISKQQFQPKADVETNYSNSFI